MLDKNVTQIGSDFGAIFSKNQWAIFFAFFKNWPTFKNDRNFKNFCCNQLKISTYTM